MKHENTLKSLTELSAEMLETKLATPVQAIPKPTRASEQQSQGANLPMFVRLGSDSRGYPHGGLND